MCGICGFVDSRAEANAEALRSRVRQMAASITHRGPDDSGTWVNSGCGVALGFRRLSIVDLSPTGHQPMCSPDDRFVIVFNGEVYNYRDIRSTLLSHGHKFRGTSDTEVMLAAFSEWGIQKAVEQFNGQFAFALWDAEFAQLYLVRDRIGVKPLYYGWLGERFYFSSELKALHRHPEFQPEIDRIALGQYFKYCYVPAPRSIYKGIKKLPPASILSIDPQTPGENPGLHKYWRLPSQDFAKEQPANLDERETVDQLEDLLRESISLRMLADVPVGAFLSGGVDSSTVVALMQDQNSQPIKTFSIGFNEFGFNEAHHAKRVADHIGTDHAELYVSTKEAMEVIPRLPHIYDEPFADSSQIPTLLVSQLARMHVTVSLSGDGGDELFMGYNRYQWGETIWRRIGWIPTRLRRFFARIINHTPIDWWDAIYKSLTVVLPERKRLPQFGDKLQKFAAVLDEGTPSSLYEQLVSFWSNPTELVLGATANGFSPADYLGWNNRYIDWMSRVDFHTYLPDDILTKVDRASMSASLEARVPMLDDHRVVEFAYGLPAVLKIRNGTTKWPLRQVLYRYVPQELIERPKMGFGMPIDQWLRGPLRDWAEAYLDSRKLQQEGFLNVTPIREKWAQHQRGDRNWQYHLWSVLMFQAWLESLSA